jgi:hypothetical protein
LVDKRIEEGLPFRLLVPDTVLPEASSENTSKNNEIRGFKESPMVLVFNEREVMIFFKFNGGRQDYRASTVTARCT